MQQMNAAVAIDKQSPADVARSSCREPAACSERVVNVTGADAPDRTGPDGPLRTASPGAAHPVIPRRPGFRSGKVARRRGSSSDQVVKKTRLFVKLAHRSRRASAAARAEAAVAALARRQLVDLDGRGSSSAHEHELRDAVADRDLARRRRGRC